MMFDRPRLKRSRNKFRPVIDSKKTRVAMFAGDLFEKADNRNARIRKTRIDGETEATEFIDERQRSKLSTMQQSIRDEVHRPYIDWLQGFFGYVSAKILGSAAPPPSRYLEVRKPIQPAKALEIHVFICGFGFALVHDVKPLQPYRGWLCASPVSRAIARASSAFLVDNFSRGDRRRVRMIAHASR